jgi:hypothetical protein
LPPPLPGRVPLPMVLQAASQVLQVQQLQD